MRTRDVRFCSLLIGFLFAACQTRPVEPSPPLASPPPPVHRARPANGFDVEHYAIDLDLDPEARAIRATCKIRLIAVKPTLGEIALDLHGLDVQSVRDAHGRELEYQHKADSLVVRLAEPVAQFDQVEIEIAYGGRPSKGLWFAGERDGRVTQVYTQGQCEDSRAWFPCVDQPAERATSELCVTMPAGWSAVAAGERIERSEAGGRARERWRMTRAHPAYLTTLVAGEFAVEHSDWDGTPLVFLAEPRYAELLRPNFEHTGEILEFLGALSGVRYPYAKYSQACVRNLPISGMENISATTLMDGALLDERARRDEPSTSLIVHEAAHQWYGNLLTCRDWSHLWLNEGFATYVEALYLEAQEGRDEFRLEMRRKQDEYCARDVGPNRRPLIFDRYESPDELFYGGQTYEGAAVRLHLLRFVVGDAAFFRGVKQYTRDHEGMSVVTDDLRRSMERASGMDLEWFFEQWFEKRGYPEFQVTWKYDERHKQVLLTVNQAQAVADGTPSAFRTPVDVEVRDSRGGRLHRVSIERRRHLFTLAAEEAPLWVRFDKGGWIPKRCDDRRGSAEWLAIAASDDDVNGRCDATRVLGRLLQSATTEEDRQRFADALLARLASDRSRAVRAIAASGLSMDASASTKEALVRAGSSDASADVRACAIRALAIFGKDPELAVFARREYAAGFSWETKAACARLLCAAEPESAFDFVVAELEHTSPHGALQSRLIPVLASLSDERVRPMLLAIARDGAAEEASRVAAVLELGRAGRGNKALRHDLVALLADGSWRVRRATIHALAVLRDDAATVALREFSRASARPVERRIIESMLSVGAGEP